MSDSTPTRARLVGINHVGLEVGDIDDALEFYGSVFDFELRSRLESKAFLDMGDQFLGLAETESAADEVDTHRHFGLVVDDPDLVARRLGELDVELPSTSGPGFCDPWGNRIQIVAYEDIQFTKAEHIREAMGLGGLVKTESAIAELAEKGMAPKS